MIAELKGNELKQAPRQMEQKQAKPKVAMWAGQELRQR
jgi:hypothetical protein